MVQHQLWEAIAAKKRASTQARIPQEWTLTKDQLDKASRQRNLTGKFIEKYLSDQEIKITRLPATVIVSHVSNGIHSALSVTKAFCKRAAIAQQMNNCLHEIFFEQAFARARDLDTHFKEHKGVVGPLHGLPVSLKDQFHVQGNDTSMGYVGWIDSFEGSPDPQVVHQVHSQIVVELLQLGAVLYCKTSLPQTLLFGETENNIIGRTLNPINQNLSCGGSSGGEGALSALGASPIGIGTDIGGSVRIPAAFCGIFSVKPTHDRFSYRDVANIIPGETTYPSSVGFMGPTLDSLHLIMTSILSLTPWNRDPYVAHIPWRQSIVDETLSRVKDDGMTASRFPLKLGLFQSDGVVTPHPPIQRGLQLLADAVMKAGHKIVGWDPPSHKIAHKIHSKFLTADGGYDVRKQLDLSGEPLISPLRRLFRHQDPMPLLDYQQYTVEGRNYERAYLDYWNSTGFTDGQQVDAVIMPTAPHAAVIPGKYFHTAYTESINLMDYSVVVIPVTSANKSIDRADEGSQPLNDLDAKNWAAYNADIYDGAPVGLQIVGRKYEEEKIWAIASILMKALGTITESIAGRAKM